MSKIPFTVTDFSGGMKGRKGQLNSADTKYVQDLNNMLVERNNTLKSRNGVEVLPITLLENDKVLPFVSNGRKFYFVYDPLLINKYEETVTGTSFAYHSGGQRHLDMFSKYNSSLSPFDYLKKETFNIEELFDGKRDTVYTGPVLTAPQDDDTKWNVFKDYVGDELGLHLHLRKLTMESSPTFVFSEVFQPNQNANLLYQSGQAHPVVENTFWWNRMFVLDEDFNVITTEIDLANFVSYDSEHTALTPIEIMDIDVRDATYDELQTIREARYGGSDLEYEVEVMNQGVMFFNREGKLPNMFMQLNDQGQTDGTLRDFRTLYLDEVDNGIFKTAPYFTTAHYGTQDLFDVERMRIEMEYIVSQWAIITTGGPFGGLDNYYQVAGLLNSYYDDNSTTDIANNPRVKFSYNVKDPENRSDVIKAFLPLTSDSSPCVEIDNIRFDTPDGQVRFASPSLANLDADFIFPHDLSTVWQVEDLAGELPFIFSPNLVIYSQSTNVAPLTLVRNNYVSPILTLVSNANSSNTFALTPITKYAGGGIGKFNDPNTAYAPIRITELTASNSTTTENAPYLPVVVYAQVFGLVTYNSSLGLIYIAQDNLFPARLGYYDGSNVFHALENFRVFTTTYQGSANTSSSGWFGTQESSSSSEYSFKILTENGGSAYSVINTANNQASMALGFNANNYFSAVSEFAGRLYLASVAKPNVIIASSTQDFLEFSVIRARVNAETDPVYTRGFREILTNEGVEALYESNNTLRVITDRRIMSLLVDDETGLVSLANPSDIITSGKSPVTINNFSYFVSGDDRDILLAVFSDKTQRFEYYSVFSEINIDDESKILSLLAIDSAYRMVVLTEQGLYLGTIVQANQIAWSRLTFNFELNIVSTDRDTLYVSSPTELYKLQFLNDTDLEDGVSASMKMLAPTALANLVNVEKTNINYNGMRLHDVCVVGTFASPLQSGSDARELSASDQGDEIEVHNKNYNDIYDSIEISFEGGQNRIIYLRGSLGV